STDDYGDLSCHSNADCPQIGCYLCVAVELSDGAVPWPQQDCRNASLCRCEVQYPPDSCLQIDAGVKDAGPPPDYCEEIRPIMQTDCLGTCHGAQMGYPNSPRDFRLDYFATPTLRDGGLGLPGVKDKADRI